MNDCGGSCGGGCGHDEEYIDDVLLVQCAESSGAVLRVCLGVCISINWPFQRLPIK